MIFGGLLAGGKGSRMETAALPKQFIRVCGIPLFIRSLRTFLNAPAIDMVVVSMNAEWREMYFEVIREFGIDESRVILVDGGDTRFTSLINIAKKAYAIAHDSTSVLVSHDCARIFVNERIIADNIAMMNEFDMVTTSLPTIDTILQSSDGRCSSVVPDRTKLWCDQGPQTFRIEQFLKYVEMIPQADLPSYIEAGKVYLSHGKKIGIVRGERFNFKVTNDIDLEYAEFLIEKGFVK